MVKFQSGRINKRGTINGFTEIGYNFINYYNHNNDNNENRHLMILTNINNRHFRLCYDSHVQIDHNFIIKDNSIKEQTSIDKDSLDYIGTDNELSKILNYIENIVNNFNDLRNLTLDDIMNIYKYDTFNKIGFDDIYFYLYHYNINDNTGKYSSKFKEIYKNKNYHSSKQSFRKKCKKFLIDDKKE